MPRRPRKNENSNYSHVIVQGIEKKYIFNKLEYKNKYYELMLKQSEKYEIKLLAYCIMDNHAHFLIYADKIERLSSCMQSVNVSFARIYNRKENRVGYVFRDRFVSEPILNERQLYMCMAYIHFNPVKAGIVKEINQYFYSSYNDYIFRKNIVTTECLKLLFWSENDFLQNFEKIHLEFSKYKINGEIEKIRDFSKLRIKKEREKQKEVCKMLKFKRMTVREIAEHLNVSKSNVNRLLRKQENNK